MTAKYFVDFVNINSLITEFTKNFKYLYMSLILSFRSTARSEYIMSLYIIFLGIVPTIGLISFGVWYARNNGGSVKQWKKAAGSSGPMSTYVSCLDCFKPRRQRPGAPNKSILERVFGPRASASNKSASVGPQTAVKPNTISERMSTLPRDKIHIVKRDLVSTTNPEAISCSSEIEYRRSVVGGTGGEEEAAAARNTAKRVSPLRTELGIKLAEHIHQLHQGVALPHHQPKNFKGLALKTDLKFEQLRESPSSSAAVTPQVQASAVPAVVASKPPAPFYDKKPPPPPAPPQSAKPKI